MDASGAPDSWMSQLDLKSSKLDWAKSLVTPRIRQLAVSRSGWQYLQRQGVVAQDASRPDIHATAEEETSYRSVLGLPVLSPNCCAVVVWSLLMSLWDLVYTAYLLPVTIAFRPLPPLPMGPSSSSSSSSSCDAWNPLDWLSLVAGLVYLADLLVGFHTGFFATYGLHRALVRSPRAVSRFYLLKSTGVADALAAAHLPLLLMAIAYGAGGAGGWPSVVLPAAMLLRLGRMVHVWSVLRMTQIHGSASATLYRHVRPAVLFLCNLSFTAACLVNALGCLWVATSRMVGVHRSWLSDVAGEDLSDAPEPVQWLTACYFAITTITTVGYGDIVAHTPPERGIAIAIMAAGVMFFSWLISSFIALLSQASQEAQVANEFRSKLESVEQWVEVNKLPRRLRHAVIDYYVEHWQPDQAASRFNVDHIRDLPAALREDVAEYLTHDVLEDSSVFGVATPDERRYLATCLRPRFAMPGHDIFRQGDSATSVVLLQDGCVQLLRFNREVELLQSPAFLGEMVLLHELSPDSKWREATCRATTPCIVWELSLDDLRQAAAVYPDLFPRVQAALLNEVQGALEQLYKQDPQLKQRLEGLGSFAVEDALEGLLGSSAGAGFNRQEEEDKEALQQRATGPGQVQWHGGQQQWQGKRQREQFPGPGQRAAAAGRGEGGGGELCVPIGDSSGDGSSRGGELRQPLLPPGGRREQSLRRAYIGEEGGPGGGGEERYVAAAPLSGGGSVGSALRRWRALSQHSFRNPGLAGVYLGALRTDSRARGGLATGQDGASSLSQGNPSQGSCDPAPTPP